MVHPIRIFDFLTRFIREDDALRMSEAQAFVTLPTFLADPAETQFCTSLSGVSRRGGVTCGPDAIEYLLRKYETPSTIRKAFGNVR